MKSNRCVPRTSVLLLLIGIKYYVLKSTFTFYVRCSLVVALNDYVLETFLYDTYR